VKFPLLSTSVGGKESAVWVHDATGDRQISNEGYADILGLGVGPISSVFSPDGRKLYYLVRRGSARNVASGELWVADVASGSSERFALCRYPTLSEALPPELFSFVSTWALPEALHQDDICGGHVHFGIENRQPVARDAHVLRKKNTGVQFRERLKTMLKAILRNGSNSVN